MFGRWCQGLDILFFGQSSLVYVPSDSKVRLFFGCNSDLAHDVEHAQECLQLIVVYSRAKYIIETT